MNPFPDFEPVERRHRAQMRVFVRHIAWLVEDGDMTPQQAGDELTKAGVPFEVQCRVIKKAVEHSKTFASRLSGNQWKLGTTERK